MQMTENYGLKKPESTDKYNVEDFNENMDSIDSKLKEINNGLEDMKTSFQDGCNTIVAGCTSYGSTPVSNSPSDIVTSIGEIYDNAYKEGAEDAEPTLQSKTATLNTSATSVTLKPDSGYDGLSQATVSITTQTKTQSITSGTATVTPDSGKVLSKVTITGPTSYAGTTKDASAVSSDDTYTYLTVPANGYYSTASKLRTLNSNLGNKIATQKVSISPFTISAAGVVKVSATFNELEEVYGITDYTLRYNWTSLLSSGNSISISGNTVTLTIFNPTGNSDSGIYGTITAVGKPK